MSLVPVLLLLFVLLEEERGGGELMGGVALGVWLFTVVKKTLGVDSRVCPSEGANNGAEADV